MKSMEEREKFIELRAEGYSIDSISKILNVSRTSLFEWEKKYKEEIDKLKQINIEELMERYLLKKEHRLKLLAKRLALIREANEMDFYKEIKQVGLNKRLDYELKLIREIREEIGEEDGFNSLPKLEIQIVEGRKD